MIPRKKREIKELTVEERIHAIKNNLSVILTSSEQCLKKEEWFSVSGKDLLREIKSQVQKIDKLVIGFTEGMIDDSSVVLKKNPYIESLKKEEEKAR